MPDRDDAPRALTPADEIIRQLQRSHPQAVPVSLTPAQCACLADAHSRLSDAAAYRADKAKAAADEMARLRAELAALTAAIAEAHAQVWPPCEDGIPDPTPEEKAGALGREALAWRNYHDQAAGRAHTLTGEVLGLGYQLREAAAEVARLNATVGAAELEREAAVSALSREAAALRAERDKLRAAAAVALDVLGAEQLTPENRHDPKTLRSLEAVLYLTDALGLPAEPSGHAGLDPEVTRA